MSETLDIQPAPAVEAAADGLRPRSGWLLFEGGALLMLGGFAGSLPWFALPQALWGEVMGLLMLSAGAVGLLACIGLHRAPGLRWSLLSGLLATLVGLLLLGVPKHGVNPLALSYFLVILFVLADGITSVAYALAHRSGRSRGWSWMLVGGMAELVLGMLMIKILIDMDRLMLMLTLPGVALAWDGLMLVMMGHSARRDPRVAAEVAESS